MKKIVNLTAGEQHESICYDPVGGEHLVETAGFIPKEAQLQMLLNSGAALDEYRRKMFPGIYSNSDDEPVFDPTSQKGYDFFDWHSDVVFVRNQLSEQERRMNVESEAIITGKNGDILPSPAPSGDNEGAGRAET